MSNGENDLLGMLPGEVEARFSAGSDIALLPVGSLEQHGPHLPLWTDGFFAQALAREIGRISGGTVLPAIPFSWVGCTNVFSGGVGVRQEVFVQYLRAVLRSLWQSGFRRIVVINGHGGNFYALRSLPHDAYREDGIPVLCTFGIAGCRQAGEILERAGGGEATEVAGALGLLGRQDLIPEVLKHTRQAVAEFGDCPEVRLEPAVAHEARRLGAIGHDYSHECLHVAPDSRLDPEAGAAAIQAAAAHIAGVLGVMGSYVRKETHVGRPTRRTD